MYSITQIRHKQFLGLITRCKDEFFIKEFCDYYKSQGVDKIYEEDKTIYKTITDPTVEVIYTKTKLKSDKTWIQLYEANKLYDRIRSDFDWIIFVDVDEFITTKKNLKKTIRDELETTFADCDCVKVPWVMMASNNIEKNPESVLQTNIYRWNHDKRHTYNNVNNNIKASIKFRCMYNNIEVKCIFRPNKFDKLHIHYPRNPNSQIKMVNSINKGPELPGSRYSNLREKDIKNGYMLCYHYRIISKENSINKLKKTLYKSKSFTLNDLYRSDYSEIKDETLKHKSLDMI